MFTLRDHRGNVVGFSGRVLDPNVKEAKYINTSETPVYVKSNVLYGLDVTKSAIAKAGEAICMEGELDLISSFQAGIGNVVAIKGSALTEGHVHLLKRFAKTLVFCLDSDVAGDAAARRGIDIAEREGFEMKAIVIPSGKDPDDAVREDPVSFKKAVAGAIPIYDFFLSSIQKRYDLTTPSGKKKASAELLPILFRITNAIVQGHYVKKLAQLMGVSHEYVDEEMRKIKVPFGTLPAKDGKEPVEALSRQEKIELYTLALLLQGKTHALWNDVKQEIPLEDFSYMPVRQIVEKLEAYLGDHADFSITLFVKTLPSELIAILDKAYLWDVSGITDDETLYQEEWKKTLRELHRTVIRKKIQDINKEVSTTEDPTLQGRLSELTRELSLLEKSDKS
jgi:DNA primase